MTDADAGKFQIVIAKELTACFDKNANIEVEVENTDGEVFTVLPGEDNRITFVKQKISWTTPS